MLDELETVRALFKTDRPRVNPPARQIDYRPWGNFELCVLNESCTVKFITVEPRQRLSLQSHELRSEWWIVLDGSMQVEVERQVRTLRAGDEIFIPQGALHRAVGLDGSCRWLEIAFGQFDENDIVRYDDQYGRS